jgi:predicted dehydrogenase
VTGAPTASADVPNAPVTAGIVGLGWWGRTLVAAIDGLPDMDIVAAVVRSPEGVAWADKHGLETHPDFSTLLEDSRIEAVIIATPNTVHHKLSVIAAAAGKHVFCEKPLGLSRAEAVATVDACRSAGVVLAVGHEIRFEPPVRDLLLLARQGRLGQLVQFDAILSHNFFKPLSHDHWRLSPLEAPAGPLTATGVHMVDLSVALLGRPTSATACLQRTGATGTLSVLATYTSGAHALIGASAVTPFHLRVAIFGTDGWAEVTAHPSSMEPGNVWTLTTSIGTDGWASVEYVEEQGIRDNLRAFVAAVRGREAYPMSNTEMVDTIGLMEAIARSAGQGGTTEDV